MPKHNDYPLEDCAAAADKLIERGATIHQKWSCGHCGTRQTMAEPNLFYRSGKCEECGKITNITACNYLVHFTPTKNQPGRPS